MRSPSGTASAPPGVKSFWKSTTRSARATAPIIGSVASPERLRELLLTPEEAAEMDAHGTTDAAVLIPLYLDSGDLHAVFTKRREDMRRHAGEISFPGGRQDEPEEDLRTTALREAEEEIGLSRDDVELVGALPPTGTFVTAYRIFPFVGVIKPGHSWTPQPREVESVLEFSLPDLVRGFEMKRLVRRGVPFKTPTYTVGDHLIWGATGRIVENLLARLEPILDRA
jgi:8-oxo-dGTP pyrophosphatase MutT (NUDIX family)